MVRGLTATENDGSSYGGTLTLHCLEFCPTMETFAEGFEFGKIDFRNGVFFWIERERERGTGVLFWFEKREIRIVNFLVRGGRNNY